MAETWPQCGMVSIVLSSFFLVLFSGPIRRQGDSETCDMLLERISVIRECMGLEDEGTYF
jgi:hypothetical protein